MGSRTRTLAALASASVLAAGVAVTANGSANAAAGDPTGLPNGTTVGLSSNGTSLATFMKKRANTTTLASGDVTGLDGDTTLVGIDYRPANRVLYGVGNSGGIYTINTSTFAATKVSQLTTALAGDKFGVDFNPAADRLRIVSNTGQSLRHNPIPAATTIVDGTLAYTPGTPAAGITGAAYTNNDNNAGTGTTLFDIDTALNRVAIQSPPNDGVLSVAGPLGVTTNGDSGFDIQSLSKNGVVTSNVGYATLRPSGTESNGVLYRIDLLSGNATQVGNFGNYDVADLAILPTTPLPAPATAR